MAVCALNYADLLKEENGTISSSGFVGASPLVSLFAAPLSVVAVRGQGMGLLRLWPPRHQCLLQGSLDVPDSVPQQRDKKRRGPSFAKGAPANASKEPGTSAPSTEFGQ